MNTNILTESDGLCYHHVCRGIDSLLKLVLRMIMDQFQKPDVHWLLNLSGE